MKTLAALLASMLLVGASAFAGNDEDQQDQSSMPQTDTGIQVETDADFATLDKDSNGEISQEEANADTTLAANFDTVDTNGDGFISRAEFDLSVKKTS